MKKSKFFLDVRRDILKLMLKKGTIPPMVQNTQQRLIQDFIEKLEMSGSNNTEDLIYLRAKNSGEKYVKLI